ncbi:hypothetical protein [Anabaena azotica]|uniref:Transposase n=1 Tax=Anabaena azotica FACHB-119 TaxID=947527 RepID=A0ABR8DD56_9NOST|nr:hypothetical protein [Anabaena azotica]MBD2505170.1 hypothetical protein [Anabaena azotica FACHB-119]
MRHKWTEEEIAILEQKAEFYTKEQIAQMLKKRGYYRSINAVEKKLWRLGYSLRPTLDNYSCRQIASVLCYDFSTVCRWVKLGWLKARKRYSKCYQIRTSRTALSLLAAWNRTLWKSRLMPLAIASCSLMMRRRRSSVWC